MAEWIFDSFRDVDRQPLTIVRQAPSPTAASDTHTPADAASDSDDSDATASDASGPGLLGDVLSEGESASDSASDDPDHV